MEIKKNKQKMSMEKTITMPLAEYEELIENCKNMVKALKEKESIPFEFISHSMGMGFTKNSWNIFTKDEMILRLLDEIKVLQQQKENAVRELVTSRNVKTERKKNWFEFIFNK